MHIDEVERLLEQDLPPGDYHTIGGLVIARLGRLPRPGDTLTLPLPPPVDDRTGRLRSSGHRAGRAATGARHLDLAVTDTPASGRGAS